MGKKKPFSRRKCRLAGLSLETRDPKKSSNVSFPLFMLFMQQNPSLSRMEVLYSSYRIFSIIFDFIAQTDLFNSASNQYSYYKFKLIRDNYSIIIVTLYISNVRYTCLYIITRYHSSYQIQTIIYILLVSLFEN